MKLRLPDEVKLTCKRNPEGQVAYTYLERVDDTRGLALTKDIAQRLVKALNLPLRVVMIEPDWIGFESIGYISVELFASMMINEFTVWGDPKQLAEVADVLEYTLELEKATSE